VNNDVFLPVVHLTLSYELALRKVILVLNIHPGVIVKVSHFVIGAYFSKSFVSVFLEAVLYIV
jgi:hypothetical protein